MTKEQREIKQLKLENEELQKKLKDSDYWKNHYQNANSDKENEIQDVHTVLDAMGVPNKTKGQYPKTLSISARLTLLTTMIGLSNVIKIKNTLLDETED
jgi:hypothetical protein